MEDTGQLQRAEKFLRSKSKWAHHPSEREALVTVFTEYDQRLPLTPREAAALDRLLDAYIGTDDADPGMDDLRALRAKVQGLGQDHTAYDATYWPVAVEPEEGR